MDSLIPKKKEDIPGYSKEAEHIYLESLRTNKKIIVQAHLDEDPPFVITLVPTMDCGIPLMLPKKNKK